jgi:hypothetical protein
MSGNFIMSFLICILRENVTRMMQSRRMRWAGHVECMGGEGVEGFGGKARRKETTRQTCVGRRVM